MEVFEDFIKKFFSARNMILSLQENRPSRSEKLDIFGRLKGKCTYCSNVRLQWRFETDDVDQKTFGFLIRGAGQRRTHKFGFSKVDFVLSCSLYLIKVMRILVVRNKDNRITFQVDNYQKINDINLRRCRPSGLAIFPLPTHIWTTGGIQLSLLS